LKVEALAVERSLFKMEKVKDTVCGMEVEKEEALKAPYKAKTYYFCNDACKSKFEENSKKYVKNEDPECY
jgi:YHS domain-containing protein